MPAKKHILLFLLFFGIQLIYAQDDSIKALVAKTKDLNLDMWELTDFAEKHLKDKEQLAKFYYYWIGSNIKYDEETYKKILNKSISPEEVHRLQNEEKVYNSRKAICEGYAKLYSWFLDWADIESVVVTGHIRDERNHYVGFPYTVVIY